MQTALRAASQGGLILTPLSKLAKKKVGALLQRRQLEGDVAELQRATTTVDEAYLELLEKGLPWLVGAAFCAGLFLGWLI
eukprot:SAG22_NODE_155_length_17123_cov_37.528489_24_plen_80_part_00